MSYPGRLSQPEVDRIAIDKIRLLSEHVLTGAFSPSHIRHIYEETDLFQSKTLFTEGYESSLDRYLRNQKKKWKSPFPGLLFFEGTKSNIEINKYIWAYTDRLRYYASEYRYYRERNNKRELINNYNTSIPILANLYCSIQKQLFKRKLISSYKEIIGTEFRPYKLSALPPSIMEADLSIQNLPIVADSFLPLEEEPTQPRQSIIHITFSVRRRFYRFFFNLFYSHQSFIPKVCSLLEGVSMIIELLYAILSCWLRLLLTGLRLICDDGIIKN